MSLRRSFKEKDVQALVGNLLRIGVVISMTVVIVGTALYILSNGNTLIHYSTFNGIKHEGILSVFKGVAQGRSNAIIELGVILLIATPIARILFALIGYWLEKDYLYTVIAFIILCIIFISILTGAAG